MQRILVAHTLCACGWFSAGRADDSTSRFPLSQFHGDVLTLPVTIDGCQHLFVLDSGASLHGFDSNLKSHLGSSPVAESLVQADGSKVNAEKFDAPAATVDHYSLGVEAPVLCADLSRLSEATGRNIKGILGMPFFAAHIIQLDFDKGELRIISGDAEAQAEWGQPIPVIYTQSNLPVIYGKIAGYTDEEPFVLDSGFNGSIGLRTELFDYLVQEGAITVPKDSDVSLVNKVVKSSSGRLSALEFAGHAQSNLNVLSGERMSRVGLAYMRRYLTTFDLGRGRIFLQPNSKFHQPDLQRSLGLSMLRKSGKTIVTGVSVGEPAAKAGVQVDDVILSVGGVPITNQPLPEVASLCRTEAGPTGVVPLMVDRGGKAKSLLVRLSTVSEK